MKNNNQTQEQEKCRCGQTPMNSADSIPETFKSKIDEKAEGYKESFTEGYNKAKEDFKENLLFKKSNHQLGCMLECYANVIENRIGFSIEAIKLEEIASKLK